MQLKNTALDEKYPVWKEETISYYLEKTYLKSASLISKSCRAAALLGRSTPEVVEAAYSYGKNLGLAFQLVDDMLDYTISGVELGKPAGADLELGLATAPLLFAWRENKELGVLVGRKFAEAGDVQKVSTDPVQKRLSDCHTDGTQARDLVLRSDGIEQTRALAQDYVDKAIRAISAFPDSQAKTGLTEMCTKVMTRRKIDQSTRLRRALHLNDLLLVKRIVRNTPQILQNPDFDDKSNTSLHLAAAQGHVDIVVRLDNRLLTKGKNFLIEAGHENDGVSRNADWDTPLMLTAQRGQVEVGRLLIEQFPRCIPWANKQARSRIRAPSLHPSSPLPAFLSNLPCKPPQSRYIGQHTASSRFGFGLLESVANTAFRWRKFAGEE
ncbi:hypothetical protein LTR28_011614 [Elasticomyces elasticus]|nr:hypothetical protein LTR28_011614 [Elasticomyces elasticus]